MGPFNSEQNVLWDFLLLIAFNTQHRVCKKRAQFIVCRVIMIMINKWLCAFVMRTSEQPQINFHLILCCSIILHHTYAKIIIILCLIIIHCYHPSLHHIFIIASTNLPFFTVFCIFSWCDFIFDFWKKKLILCKFALPQFSFPRKKRNKTIIIILKEDELSSRIRTFTQLF